MVIGKVKGSCECVVWLLEEVGEGGGRLREVVLYCVVVGGRLREVVNGECVVW